MFPCGHAGFSHVTGIDPGRDLSTVAPLSSVLLLRRLHAKMTASDDNPCNAERCESGRIGVPGEHVCWQRHRGFESHPLRHHAESDRMQNGAPSVRRTGRAGGIRTGVLKGVGPLQGVTEAKRRREGAWPPSGSMDGVGHATLNAHPLRHDIRRKRRPHGAMVARRRLK